MLLCPTYIIKFLESDLVSITHSAFDLSRNPQPSGNWADLNRLTNRRSVRSATTNNRNGRLNTEREINNRSAANLRSLNIPSAIGADQLLN